jgi:hypothetical protein
MRDLEVTRMKANKSKKSEKYNDMMSSASSRKGIGKSGSALARRQTGIIAKQSDEGS